MSGAYVHAAGSDARHRRRRACLRVPDRERGCAETCSRRASAGTRAGRPRSPAPLLTPSGWRNSTSMPSRTPSPLNESGSTCTIATAGDERERRRDRHRQVEGAEDQRDREHHRSLVDDRGAEHGERLAGLVPQAVDADVDRADERVQFVCSAKRPAILGWPASTRSTTKSTSVMPGDERARSTRGRRRAATAAARKPRNTSSGSATNPVSRSSATDANAIGDELDRVRGA